MQVQRVWLEPWEWGCCGEPFAVGDVVTFQVHPGAGAWITELAGSAFAASVDARESHHDDRGPERLHGTVLAIEAVGMDHEWRRVLIERPAREGMVPHASLTSEIVPGAPVLREIPGVGRASATGAQLPMPNPVGDERIRQRATVGYLVTLSV